METFEHKHDENDIGDRRMSLREIINLDEFNTAIDAGLCNLPTVLAGHRTELRKFLEQAVREHRNIERARRRKSDPDWAQTKFAAGHPLYRFCDEDGIIASDIRELVSTLTKLAKMASTDKTCPFAHEASSLLKGMAHRNDGMDHLEVDCEHLLQKKSRAVLLAGRCEIVRDTAPISFERLEAVPCRSLDDVISLGKEATNCLANWMEHWESFTKNRKDFWSIRRGGKLVGVLSMSNNEVEEIFASNNKVLAYDDSIAVARFCAAAGWTLKAGCEGILPQFAGPVIVGPTRLLFGNWIAIYIEWETAVRIDLSKDPSHPWLREPTSLLLAFDQDRPLADMVLNGAGPRSEVSDFGKKRLRKVMHQVAMGQHTPTLVQHRLMALCL